MSDQQRVVLQRLCRRNRWTGIRGADINDVLQLDEINLKLRMLLPLGLRKMLRKLFTNPFMDAYRRLKGDAANGDRLFYILHAAAKGNITVFGTMPELQAAAKRVIDEVDRIARVKRIRVVSNTNANYVPYESLLYDIHTGKVESREFVDAMDAFKTTRNTLLHYLDTHTSRLQNAHRFFGANENVEKQFTRGMLSIIGRLCDSRQWRSWF